MVILFIISISLMSALARASGGGLALIYWMPVKMVVNHHSTLHGYQRLCSVCVSVLLQGMNMDGCGLFQRSHGLISSCNLVTGRFTICKDGNRPIPTASKLLNMLSALFSTCSDGVSIHRVTAGRVWALRGP